LVRTTESAVELIALDDDGHPRSAPVPISAGTGLAPRRPRLAARDDLIAVTWEGAGQRTWAVAVDDSARPSVPVELGAGLSPLGSVVAASDDGFVVAYADEEIRA